MASGLSSASYSSLEEEPKAGHDMEDRTSRMLMLRLHTLLPPTSVTTCTINLQTHMHVALTHIHTPPLALWMNAPTLTTRPYPLPSPLVH
jgi:hypothetical protein